MARFILASASPQRVTLLKGIDFPFETIPSNVDESACSELDPLKRSVLLAEMKARSIAEKHPDAWVLGCDTLVVSEDGTLLEKPVDQADARRMISLQSGQTSVVHSALSLIRPDGKVFEDVSSSRVTFKHLSEEDVDWWMETGLWQDRSGSFQIDGKGQLMIENLEGDFTGVVGLPLFLFGDLLKKAEY